MIEHAAVIARVQLIYQGLSCYMKGAAAISRVEQQYQGLSSYIKGGAARAEQLNQEWGAAIPRAEKL